MMNELFGLDSATAAKGGGAFISFLVLLRWLVSWTRKQDTIDATSKGLQELLLAQQEESKKWKASYDHAIIDLEILRERETMQSTKLALMRMSLIHNGIEEEFLDVIMAKEFPKEGKKDGTNSSPTT